MTPGGRRLRDRRNGGPLEILLINRVVVVQGGRRPPGGRDRFERRCNFAGRVRPELDVRIGRIMRESCRHRGRCRRDDFVDRCHGWDEMVPRCPGIFTSQAVALVERVQFRRCARGGKGIEHVAGDTGRRGDVLVGRGHGIRCNCHLREMFRWSAAKI